MKTAIVLGGTVPHITLINKLKERGFYTILVDFFDNPPAQKYADEHIKESTLDKDVIVKIAQKRKVDLVISTCIDQANSICCYVAEKLNLPHPYSYQTSLLVTDKGQMKLRMLENCIPTSLFTLTKSLEDIQWPDISYPCVVKPVDCNSSKGVHRADNREEVTKYVEEALGLSRTKTAIIEGFCEGYEIQVDCIAISDTATVVMTRQKIMTKRENATVLQSYGSIVPAPLSESLKEKVNEIAKKIARGFNLNNTPFFYQAIVKDDNIYVLEFAPRIGGGLSFYMLQHFIGYDAVDAAIDSFLGNPITINIHPVDKCYRTCLLYALPCVFNHVEGFDELKQDGLIDDFFITKTTGDKIDGDLRSSNRVGSFIVSGQNLQEVNNKVAECLNNIRVIDENGLDKTNRLII